MSSGKNETSFLLTLSVKRSRDAILLLLKNQVHLELRDKMSQSSPCRTSFQKSSKVSAINAQALIAETECPVKRGYFCIVILVQCNRD